MSDCPQLKDENFKREQCSSYILLKNNSHIALFSVKQPTRPEINFWANSSSPRFVD
jgi:hypothetical protein